MSDSWVKIIPADPQTVPDAAAVARVEYLLKHNYRSDVPIAGTTSGEIEFRDNGANLENILCPKCGRDLQPYWKGWCEESYSKSRFADRIVTAPCCGNTVDLNDLDYRGPAGFSRFEISLRNPGGAISQAHLQQIAEILGFPVKQIFSHM